MINHDKCVAMPNPSDASKSRSEGEYGARQNRSSQPFSASNQSSRIEYRRASDIQAKPVHWLWPGRIARGKVSMIAGNPGLGKSQTSANIAAIVTTGGNWPVDNASCDCGSVLFLSAEDDPADTIRPRLEAAEADLDKVAIIEAVLERGKNGEGLKRLFNLKTDIVHLEKVMNQVGDVALVVIDPITAYLGETDSHKNADVRALLAYLADFAAAHNAAVLCITHLNKSAGGQAIQKVSGSLAFVAAARAAFAVVPDKEDQERRLFLPIKNNIGNDKTGLAFSITSVELEHPGPCAIETSKIIWADEIVTVSVDEIMGLQQDSDKKYALQEAKEFLMCYLADGPVSVKKIKQAAKDAGIADITLRRAQNELGVDAIKQGMSGGWMWIMPAKGD